MDNIEKANSKIECDSLIDCLRYYALVAPDLWIKGRNIAESEYLPNESMTTYESRALFNTKGNFRGYGHTEFYDLLEKPINEAILDIKKMLKDLE
jgi:hypothetical protein